MLCSDTTRPSRERRAAYDTARNAIEALDDDLRLKRLALAATEDSQCRAQPCILEVPYDGVDEIASLANPRSGRSGDVTMAFEISITGRVVAPDDPESFRITGDDVFFGPLRRLATEWQFDPTPVPVCTLVGMRFR